MQLGPIAEVLIFLLAANGTPILAQKFLGGWCAWPLDLGARFVDGRPILGRSKTYRGVVVAVFTTAAIAPLLGQPWQVGALIAAAAMGGDLLSSFVKRRLQVAPSGKAPVWDQVPESLLPMLVCRQALGLGWLDIVTATALFWIGGLLLSRALFALKIRDRPY
jgi:CDP-2,3-bis-(O-geranylgeranyl)-sn-glycerol synthase